VISVGSGGKCANATTAPGCACDQNHSQQKFDGIRDQRCFLLEQSCLAALQRFAKPWLCRRPQSRLNGFYTIKLQQSPDVKEE
jgi:hypothetical protein